VKPLRRSTWQLWSRRPSATSALIIIRRQWPLLALLPRVTRFPPTSVAGASTGVVWLCVGTCEIHLVFQFTP
jgi:hypothetical protein